MADVGALDTMEGLMSGVYDYAGNPPTDKVPESLVLEAIQDRIQHYRNEMSLQDEGWSLERLVITVARDQEEYDIVPGDFGRPFFVETFDDSKPRFLRTSVEICRAQDRDLYTRISGEISTYRKHSARVFIFRNIGMPVASLQVLPVPREPAQYRIWYESIVGDEYRAAEVPNFLRHFFPLIKVDACMDILGLCEYSDSKYNQIYQQRAMQHTQYLATFEAYICNIYHEKTGPVRAANSSRRARGRVR